jgi:Asp-tRNA(Asn)/Glu-tRNA(Gln) amidotransferase A subunit family amidase
VPDTDATVVARLKAAGAILIAKKRKSTDLRKLTSMPSQTT